MGVVSGEWGVGSSQKDIFTKKIWTIWILKIYECLKIKKIE